MEHWSMVERFQPVSKKGEAADPSAPSCSVISSTLHMLQQLQLLHTLQVLTNKQCDLNPMLLHIYISLFNKP